MITKEFEKARANAKKEIKNENPFRIFENEKFGELEIFMEEGIIWIEASKSAEILGYKNPRKVIKDHCLQERVTIRSSLTNGGKQEKKFITEGNLYRLIARLKLPSAVEFEKWIFETVIPSIRKYGYYSNEVPKISREDELMLKVMKSRSEEELLSNMAIYNLEVVIPLQKELEVARSKAETYDEFLDADGTITSTTLAINFGLQSARLFNELMHRHGVIAKVGKSWRPARKYINTGIMKAVEFGYNHKKKNENLLLLLENNLDKSDEVSTEIVALNSNDIVLDEKEIKGVMFKWTLTGLEVAKRILLENEYIEKVDEKYIANSEKIAEFKKNYKKAK